MQAIMALLMAALPQAILAIAAKLLSQDLFQKILEKVIIFGLEKAVAMTTNTVDDDLVKLVRGRLENNVAP